jgi:hypothetical protein
MTQQRVVMGDSSGRPPAGPRGVLDHPPQLPARKAPEQRVADFVKALPGAKVEYDGVFEPNDDRERFQTLVLDDTNDGHPLDQMLVGARRPRPDDSQAMGRRA